VKPAGVAAVGGAILLGLDPASEVRGSLVKRLVLWLVMVSAVQCGDSGEDAGKLLECGNLAVVRWRERRSCRWMLERGGGDYKVGGGRGRHGELRYQPSTVFGD
jgi:hypothetical protein